jgi:hypothetical protein
MENRNVEPENADREIAYSRTVKAGKRIYYLDVKRSRNEDFYLSLTESKKKVSGNPDNPDVSYEKHKIFLYREDLAKFTEALIDVIRFIQEQEGEDSDLPVEPVEMDEDPPIRLNLGDFE